MTPEDVDQTANGDGNTQIGRDGVVLNDSPNSTVFNNTYIGVSPEELRKIIQEELQANESKYTKPIESSEIEAKPKIEHFNISIQNLLGDSRGIMVPRYQRNFIWKPEQVAALLQNYVLSEVESHIGTMMLSDSGGSEPMEVVDGGQRLYALSIIFSAIRDFLEASGKSDFASGVHTGLIADYFQGPKFIPLKRHRDYFLRSIQSFPNSDFSNPETKSEKNIADCYAKVLEELAHHDPNFIISRVTQVVKLDAALTIVKADNKSDLYEHWEKTFATINQKSAPLTLEDLNHVRKMRGKPPISPTPSPAASKDVEQTAHGDGNIQIGGDGNIKFGTTNPPAGYEYKITVGHDVKGTPTWNLTEVSDCIMKELKKNGIDAATVKEAGGFWEDLWEESTEIRIVWPSSEDKGDGIKEACRAVCEQLDQDAVLYTKIKLSDIEFVRRGEG
tara:strand:- start:1553 stop:2890 length:1338 start_codon:yes stop_codon:yes gene_type:complete